MCRSYRATAARTAARTAAAARAAARAATCGGAAATSGSSAGTATPATALTPVARSTPHAAAADRSRRSRQRPGPSSERHHGAARVAISYRHHRSKCHPDGLAHVVTRRPAATCRRRNATRNRSTTRCRRRPRCPRRSQRRVFARCRLRDRIRRRRGGSRPARCRPARCRPTLRPARCRARTATHRPHANSVGAPGASASASAEPSGATCFRCEAGESKAQRRAVHAHRRAREPRWRRCRRGASRRRSRGSEAPGGCQCSLIGRGIRFCLRVGAAALGTQAAEEASH